MKATEKVPDLAIRGRVLVRGGYTPAEIRKMTEEEILFVYHYQEVIEKERTDSLLSSLGVMWDLDVVRETKESGGQKSNKLIIPLAAGINPKIFELINAATHNPVVQGYTPQKGEKIVPMSKLSKDEFLNLVGSSGVGGRPMK